LIMLNVLVSQSNINGERLFSANKAVRESTAI
jgi:hypothetical protein